MDLDVIWISKFTDPYMKCLVKFKTCLVLAVSRIFVFSIVFKPYLNQFLVFLSILFFMLSLYS